MVFYDNLGTNNEENLTEKARKQREQIKKNLVKTLEGQGFTNKDIARVMDVIDVAEGEIQAIKDSLIGTNINNEDPDPMKVLYDGKMKIREREIKMGQEIKDMVALIKKERGLG